MEDFTLTTLEELLLSFKKSEYNFQTFRTFMKSPRDRAVILRHDIDARKNHALKFADLQSRLGMTGTYYFRMVPGSFDEKLIREIADLGHEIGYHYEDMDFANGDPDQAITLFEKHLKQLRQIVPIHTICMHGSPKSAYDNKDVWQKYNYRDFGLIGEPYFDLNFDKVFYLTDTGRRWDGHKVSVRDKVNTHYDFDIKNTKDIISMLDKKLLPKQIMINFHPQRWTNNPWLWTTEKYTQKIKNIVKYYLIKHRQKNPEVPALSR